MHGQQNIKTQRNGDTKRLAKSFTSSEKAVSIFLDFKLWPCSEYCPIFWG